MSAGKHLPGGVHDAEMVLRFGRHAHRRLRPSLAASAASAPRRRTTPRSSNSTGARPSISMWARPSAAAMTAMRGFWHGISANTSRAIRSWCRRTCRGPAATRRPASCMGRLPRRHRDRRHSTRSRPGAAADRPAGAARFEEIHLSGQRQWRRLSRFVRADAPVKSFRTPSTQEVILGASAEGATLGTCRSCSTTCWAHQVPPGDRLCGQP